MIKLKEYKIPIWVQEASDKKGYTMFRGVKPKKEIGRNVYYIGNVTNQEQGNILLYKNGRVSIFNLIQFLTKGV